MSRRRCRVALIPVVVAAALALTAAPAAADPTPAGGPPTTSPSAAPPAATPAGTAAATSPGAFTALTPARLLDTRSGNGTARGRVAPGRTVAVPVAGRGGVPATGASAVVLTLTATSVTSAGYVTVFPGGRARPTVSNLNLLPGRTLANLVTVPLGADGSVAFYSGAGAALDLVADVSGYYVAGAPTAAGTTTVVTPARVVDTRSGLGTTRAPLAGGQSRSVPVAGRGGVPTGTARSVVLDVTVVAPVGAGYLTAYPGGTDRPTTSNLNFTAGQTLAAQVTVPLGADGAVALYVSAGVRADVVVDVQAWVRAGAVLVPGAFRAASPQRLIDTRQQSTPEYGHAAVPAGGTVSVQYASSGVPEEAVAGVLLTVTATDTRSDGYVTAYPAGRDRPLASNLNFRAGATVPDAVAVAAGEDARIEFYNGSSATIELVVDVAGYWFDGTLGAVGGVVSGPDGRPLAGVQVAVVGRYASQDDGLQAATFSPEAVTDVTGRYTADAVPAADEAQLCFSTTHATPTPGATGLASVCTRDTLIAVRAGRVTRADHVLAGRGAAVHGRLLGAAGAPLAGVRVHLGAPGSSTTQSEPVTTGADGSYDIVGLDPQGYVQELCLGVIAPSATAPTGYPAQCPSVYNTGRGDALSDAVANEGVVLTGTVTDTAGHPLSHVGVQVGVGADPDGRGINTFTTSSGSYRLLVDPGDSGATLSVCFQGTHDYAVPISPGGGSSTTGYVERCWKDQPMVYYRTGNRYTEISAAPGDTVTGIGAALPAAAAVSGQVRRPGGAPMADVTVVVTGRSDDVRFEYEAVQSDADGRYRVAALRPGSYSVCFVPTQYNPIPPPTGLITQCWHQVSPYEFGQVQLTSGAEVRGIDADLNAGGSITGRITDASGAPLAKVHVAVDGQQTDVVTTADGRYRFDWVQPGAVRVFARAYEATGGTSPGGYDDGCIGCDTDDLHRPPVTVAAGATSTADLTLGAAAAITATVTDAQGNVLAGAHVSAYPQDGGSGGGGAGPTDAQGHATIGHLAPGTYTVCVDDLDGVRGGSSPSGYLQTCTSPSPRTYQQTVTVTDGRAVAVTLVAPPGAGVTGRLTDASGRPVHDVRVQVFGLSFPQDGDNPVTDADGRFLSTGLLAGSYTVCFTGGAVDDTDEQFTPSCWKNLPNDGSGTNSTLVRLRVGTLVSGVDQVLPLG